MAKTKKSTKKKIKKNIPIGSAFIQSSFNNTIISITDPQGNVVAWSSGGVAGFKGSRKSTPFAAQIAAENAAKKGDGEWYENRGCLYKRPWRRQRGSIEGITKCRIEDSSY